MGLNPISKVSHPHTRVQTMANDSWKCAHAHIMHKHDTNGTKRTRPPQAVECLLAIINHNAREGLLDVVVEVPHVQTARACSHRARVLLRALLYQHFRGLGVWVWWGCPATDCQHTYRSGAEIPNPNQYILPKYNCTVSNITFYELS